MSFFQIDQHLRHFKATAQGTQGVELMAALDTARKALKKLALAWPRGANQFHSLAGKCDVYYRILAQARKDNPYDGGMAPKPLLEAVRSVKSKMMHEVNDSQDELEKIHHSGMINLDSFKKFEKILTETYMAV